MAKTISVDSKRLKRIGLLILLLPLSFLLLFLFGETLGGDISGLGHLLQIIPLVVLGLLANKYPYVGGIILTFAGFTLALLYATFAGFSVGTVIIVDGVLFLPLALSGYFLISSSLK